MKLSKCLLIGALATSSLSHAITYNLSAVQTGFTSAMFFRGNPVDFTTDGLNGNAITGSLEVNGSNAVLDLDVGTLHYSVVGFDTGDQVLLNGGSLFYGSNVVNDSYYDYGGYGSYYYETSYNIESIFGTTTPPAPATASGTGSLAAIVPAFLNNLSVVTDVGDIILSGEESYTEYNYDDPSQTGTPTQSGYSYTYDREPFQLTLTYRDVTSGDFLLSETFDVSFTPVPVPAAGWLFASALGLLVARRRQRQ